MLEVRHVVERNDATVRTAEGLPLVSGVLVGGDPGEREIEASSGCAFWWILLHGQKTGLYLDQLENYAIVAQYARGRRVLDCFANQGGFALACARTWRARGDGRGKRGREREEAAAERPLEMASASLLKRRTSSPISRPPRGEADLYDMIILDPPSFTRARGKINDALRGYRELHLRSAKLLAAEGVLATFSCSHHVSAGEFESAVAGGFSDAKRSARIIRRLGQGADHPILLNLPETSYLKGLLLDAMAGR